ncbi:hypothetical protein AAP_06140 [Ascosphaera apis ARSEF 7405]|uniref:Outer spore wall protein RRT8 n=1 Tax=Ascosphaera apis ARSEF 7405 TaxID=392613 RepID=A0A167V0U5_9EURO|nr:hypothetical protein AAP_06140 [Ascosphaera apis ARSEF 7405]
MSEPLHETESVTELIVRTFIEEVQHFRDLLTEGVRSGGWLYPFQGIYYLFKNRALWQPLADKMPSVTSLSITVTTTMFFLTYLPQMTMLALTSGRKAAPFSAALLVLSESATITNFIAQHTFLENSLTDIFDGTLVSCGCSRLVKRGRLLKQNVKDTDPLKKLGSLMQKPLPKFSLETIIRPLALFPLTLIPHIGTFMYIALQGRKVGPAYHARYFQLREMDKKKKDSFINAHRGGYASFGAAAYALEMVPFASLAFAYSNAVGAAIWASEIEQGKVPAEIKKD